MERGHSIISSSIIDLAVSEVMPEHAARAMGVEPAGAASTLNTSETTATWICRRCGRPARVEKPQSCPVCEGTSFQPVDKAAIAAVAPGRVGENGSQKLPHYGKSYALLRLQKKSQHIASLAARQLPGVPRAVLVHYEARHA